MKEQNTLLKKIVILFILVLIPLMFFSFFYLHRNNMRQKNQALSAIQSNSSTYISHLDASLKQVYTANLHVIEEDLLSDLSASYPFLSAYEKSLRINLLRNQLYSICSASSLLESAHAYLFDYRTVYNSSHYKCGSYQTLDSRETEFYQALNEESGLMQYYLDPVTKQQRLSVFMSPFTSRPAYAINLIVSQDYLKEYLDSNASYAEDYYIFHLPNGFSLSTVPEDKEADARQILTEYSQDPVPSYQTVELDGETFFAFSGYTSYSDGVYLRLISSDALMPAIHYSYYLLFLFFVLVVFSCILFFIGIYRMIHKPFQKLVTAFDEVEKGNFQIRIAPEGNKDFAYLYHAFNDMTLHLSQLIEQDYRQKMLLQKAEMKQLQAQINPHFLYNSFFMLQRMIKTDPDGAQEVGAALASCFRYITRNSMDNVMLAEEYGHARSYAYIQGLRFEGRIRIVLEPLPEQFCHIQVPKLILQPILENAFNYGLKNKVADGLVQVRFLTRESTVTIRIEDNGDELSDSTLTGLQKQLETTSRSSAGTEMSGILNIQRRLLIFSDYKDSLHITRSALGGLCVEITLQEEKNERIDY